MFDGRIAEDFKLSTGTFVSVGPLRAKIIAAGDPLVQDVVIAGINRERDRRAVLPAPRRLPRASPGCRPTRRRTTCSADADACAPSSSAWSTSLHATGTGSATRVARALVLAEPPSIDKRRGHRQGLDQPARRADRTATPTSCACTSAATAT